MLDRQRPQGCTQGDDVGPWLRVDREFYQIQATALTADLRDPEVKYIYEQSDLEAILEARLGTVVKVMGYFRTLGAAVASPEGQGKVGVQIPDVKQRHIRSCCIT
jgi:hypothetical protein